MAFGLEKKEKNYTIAQNPRTRGLVPEKAQTAAQKAAASGAAGGGGNSAGTNTGTQSGAVSAKSNARVQDTATSQKRAAARQSYAEKQNSAKIQAAGLPDFTKAPSLGLKVLPAMQKQQTAASEAKRQAAGLPDFASRPTAALKALPVVEETARAGVPLAGYQPSVGQRIKTGAQSIGHSLIGSFPALAENLWQMKTNAETDNASPEVQALRKENETLLNQLQAVRQGYGNESWGTEDEIRARIEANTAKLGELETKTAVDQGKFGQTMLRQSREEQAATVMGMKGVPAFLVGTGLSMANNVAMLPLAMIHPALPLIGMGAQAAAGKTTELNERGIAPDEAFARGLAAGGIEVATEKIPLDELADVVKTGGKSALANALKQAGVEATEESISYIANYVADKLAKDQDAHFSWEELGLSAAGGAVSGSGLGLIGTGANKLLGVDARTPRAGAENAQTAEQNTQAGKISGEAQGTQAASVGRATTIQNPYTGKTPVNAGPDVKPVVVKVSNNDLMAAQAQIENAQKSEHFVRTIKKSLQDLFAKAGGQRQTQIQNVTFDEKPYIVELNPNISAKVASDGNISAEKLAVFYHLDSAVAGAEYVGSGNYGKSNTKAPNVIRYDYFENEISVNDKPYIMTFDVEVYRDRNNFRTYRVINEIDLTPSDAYTSHSLAADTDIVSDLYADSITQNEGNGNPGILRQGVWQEGEVKPRLKAEEDVRPESAPPMDAETEARLQAQLEAIESGEYPSAGLSLKQAKAKDRAAHEAAEIKPEDFTIQGARLNAEDLTGNAGAKTQAIGRGQMETLKRSWDVAKQAEAHADELQARLTLTDRDMRFVESALNTDSTSNFYETDNPQAATQMYYAKRAVRDARAPIQEFNRARREAMELQAAEDAEAIATKAKDKANGLLYQRETMERNIRDIFKNSAEGEAIIERYFKPVHEAVAEGNRLKERLRGEVKALNLDADESALVQMIMEGETGAAADYIAEHNIKITAERNQKINDAAEKMQQIYDELYDLMNEALIRNGKEPAPYRKNYAPHFVEVKASTVLGRILQAAGLYKPRMDQLPTDLAGITETFRPGKKFFANLLPRTTKETVYDAVRGFDQYIEGAADEITLTDGIENLRALEDAVRYRLSDEGTRTMVDAIRSDRSKSALEQREKIEKLYDEKKYGMRDLVTELRRYTDNLAGKKSRDDRAWEDKIGRDIYQIAKNVEGRVAANMIAANPGSWLTNLIPLTQATGEVPVASLLKGMKQTVNAYVLDDGFVDASTFLTNRRGSQSIARTTGRKISDALGAPMEWIDQFTADSIVRARYDQNIKKGMDIYRAMDEADSFAAGLMADRSKGAMPTLFNAQNPGTKLFTMFQLEVNNQLSYMGKDLKRRLGEQGAGAVALGLTKMFAGAYIYNQLYSELTGRDAAFDPFGAIFDAFDIDPIEEVKRAIGKDDDKDKEKEKPTIPEALESLGGAVLDQTPFIGGLLGGGRVPISSALPDWGNLWTALTDEEKAGSKRLEMALNELKKPALYLLPPFGGGAIKKAREGAQMIREGGSFTLNNDGERELQFPYTGKNELDAAQAILFGKYSTDAAQEYVDSGFKRMNAEDTAIYEQAARYGFDNETIYRTLETLNAVQAVKNVGGDTEKSKKQAQREALFAMDNLTTAQKDWIDRVKLRADGDNWVDYRSEDGFKITSMLPENRQIAAKTALRAGVSADTFIRYDTLYRKERGDEDNDISAGAWETLAQIKADEELSRTEKQALTEYLLIDQMGQKAKEDWERAKKAGVQATDFVQIEHRISGYRESLEKTDADRANAISTMLKNCYMTDEQRDVMFQTYSENREKNPFHVSVYESQIDKETGFYSNLTEQGQLRLRALLNDYEQDIDEEKDLDGWKGKAYMAEKEAEISPAIYAMYRVALEIADTDDNGNYSQQEAERAVRMLSGLSQQQRAYLFASTNSLWKKNPFGSATVTKYNNGEEDGSDGPRKAAGYVQDDSELQELLTAATSSGSGTVKKGLQALPKLKSLPKLKGLPELKMLPSIM